MNNYIYWPVRLNGERYHITLKYLGDVIPKPEDIVNRLREFKNLMPMLYEWKATTFKTNEGPTIYVMEFTKFSPTINEMHDALNLREDDYKPYRPHIILPQAVWERFAGEKIPLNHVELFVGMPQAKINALNLKIKYPPYNLLYQFLL